MKKNRVIILALFVVLLLGTCADDLLVDTLRVDTKATNQTEIDGNPSDQEEPPVGEPDISGDNPVPDLPAGNVGAEVAPFDWDVFIAQRAAWEQMAWGQTGYEFI
ncbi:MAG: hypothetical protein LBI85_05565, partial [Spirochaetaceae bacterium]|nr:hypothetical protein [Spirochaetaceae bacterium]